jgi:hypothetical protein
MVGSGEVRLMALQVRLRHALGERVLELAPRTVDDPIVLGRAAEADVQVPSVNVGAKHAVVFIHEGHWVVQDTSSTYPTFVNGQQLNGPHVLHSGDVIVLGNDANAPMIEIDPEHAAGGQDDIPAEVPAAAGGYAGQYPAAAGATPAYGYAPPATHMVATGRPVPHGGAYAAHPAQHAAPAAPEYQEHPEPEGGADHAEWAAAATAGSRRPGGRRPKRSSDAAVGVAIVAAVAIVSIVGLVVYQRSKQPPVQTIVKVEPKKAPVVEPRGKAPPKSIFTDGGAPGSQQLPPGYVPPKTGYDSLEDTANLRKPAPLPDLTDDQPPAGSKKSRKGKSKPADDEAADAGADAGDEATDAGESADEGGGKSAKSAKRPKPAGGGGDTVISETDPTFKRVENAYYSPDPAKALLTFDAYEEEFPGKHSDRIAQYREDMLDKIWWDRIDSLFEKRKELTQGIKETQLAIKEETEEAHKKTVLEPRLEDQKTRVASLGEKLSKDMGYRLTTAPPITDEKAMVDLRAKRDKGLYDAWKKRVLKHIRDKHGDYPWANEK